MSERLSPAQAAKTALHEAAHITLGHIEDDHTEYLAHRGRYEVEAESVAYVMPGLLGLDTSAYSVDSFARWISAALAAHAALTPAQRATAAAELPEEPRSGSGFTRSFELDDTTVQAMEDAITADRRAHRFVTRSQFGNEAVRAAIEAAKTRAGGVLPPAQHGSLTGRCGDRNRRRAADRPAIALVLLVESLLARSGGHRGPALSAASWARPPTPSPGQSDVRRRCCGRRTAQLRVRCRSRPRCSRRASRTGCRRRRH